MFDEYAGSELKSPRTVKIAKHKHCGINYTIAGVWDERLIRQ